MNRESRQRNQKQPNGRSAVRHMAGLVILNRPPLNARRELHGMPELQAVEARSVGLDTIEQNRIERHAVCISQSIGVVSQPLMREAQGSSLDAKIKPEDRVDFYGATGASCVHAIARRPAQYRSLPPPRSAVPLRVERAHGVCAVSRRVDIGVPVIKVAPRLIEGDVAEYRAVEAGSRSRGAQPGEQASKQGRFHVGEETRQGSANSLDYANQ